MKIKLINLATFHFGMKKLNVDVATFDFEYNNILCSCIFEADYLLGFSLTFFKTITGEMLRFPVRPGYLLDTFIKDSDLYHKFWKYFNMSPKDGGFTMRSFYESLNLAIPPKFNSQKNIDRPVLAKRYKTEKKERPYFLGFKNWNVIKAKNPAAKGTRSKENLEKTQKLYPLIYQATKDHDISVRYTDHDTQKDKHFQELLKMSFNNEGIV